MKIQNNFKKFQKYAHAYPIYVKEKFYNRFLLSIVVKYTYSDSGNYYLKIT